MVDVSDKETRRVFMEEMVKTRGWEILREEILEKRKQAVSKLINGSPSNIEMQEVVACRARIKVIDELLSSVPEIQGGLK